MLVLAVSCDAEFSLWQGVGNMISDLRGLKVTVNIDETMEEF